MGWEMRGNYGPYYTRSRRVGARVVREYVGKDRIAQLAAQLDEIDRMERQAKSAEHKQDHNKLQECYQPLQELCEITDLLVKATLVSAGYYRHHRGEWRRRREQKMQVQSTEVS